MRGSLQWAISSEQALLYVMPFVPQTGFQSRVQSRSQSLTQVRRGGQGARRHSPWTRRQTSPGAQTAAPHFPSCSQTPLMHWSAQYCSPSAVTSHDWNDWHLSEQHAPWWAIARLGDLHLAMFRKHSLAYVVPSVPQMGMKISGQNVSSHGLAALATANADRARMICNITADATALVERQHNLQVMPRAATDEYLL